jgi:hypothetical protein
MKKDEYRQWFADQLLRQTHLLTGAVAAMLGLGLVATIIESTIFAMVLHFGFYSTPWIPSYIVVLSIQGLMLFFLYNQLSKRLSDTEHQVEIDDAVTTIRTAPTMTTVWTYALGSLETDQTWLERLASILALPQRLFCAALFTWERILQLKAVDVSDCSAVLRLLHRKEERVEIGDLMEGLQLSDLTTTLRNVSLVDGVMFLKQKSMGLSLSRRMTDAMWEWSQKNKTAE